MRLFAFWPILVLLGIPDTVILYWEHDQTEYADDASCSARLPGLEAQARADPGFMGFIRSINFGEMPRLEFSRECVDKPPMMFREELRGKGSPGERT